MPPTGSAENSAPEENLLSRRTPVAWRGALQFSHIDLLQLSAVLHQAAPGVTDSRLAAEANERAWRTGMELTPHHRSRHFQHFRSFSSIASPSSSVFAGVSVPTPTSTASLETPRAGTSRSHPTSLPEYFISSSPMLTTIEEYLPAHYHFSIAKHAERPSLAYIGIGMRVTRS